MSIPTRTLGKTGAEVTIFGLGGEGVLRTWGREREAEAMIRRALDLGVTYFESARAYAGSEEYLGRALGRDRDRVFLATKSHHRRARGAQAHLDESLALLRTTWIDLWYVHDVRTRADLETLAGPGGALETVARARKAGQVRFAGVSGHESPAVLREALDLFDFDCVLLPMNPGESGPGSFAETVLPVARGKNLGVVAMKTLCRGLALRIPGGQGADVLLHYALGVPGVTLASVGCDDPEQVEANATAAASFAPLPPDRRELLERQLSAYRRELLYYRPRG
ncbi:MAG: aldo/keto reductase [Thermodesulfobacteriota bacterium]|jgi:aryl-alcohol dehydrogenase-like predicted oxidoreductase